MKYLKYLFLYFIMQILAYSLTPLLATIYVNREGWCNNRSHIGIEPRLPTWLSWFDTPDNSLLGDNSWKTSHDFSYWSRLGWLYRNSLYGFKWTVLGLSMPNTKAWQWRYYTNWIKLDFGWLIDPYEKNPDLYKEQPKALFQLSIRPRIFSWMKNYINTKLLKNAGWQK